MKRALIYLVLLLPAIAGAQERYIKFELGLISDKDTLRWGWIDTQAPDADRAVALANTYGELFAKREKYRSAQGLTEMFGDDNMSKMDAEQDAYWEGLRKTYQQMLSQEGLSDETRKELENNLADIDKYKAESKQNLKAQANIYNNESKEMIAGADPSEFSDERLLLIKKNLKKYALGGRLWGFEKARDFRNGFAAVCRKDRSGNSKWGFINRNGKLAIPCKWDEAFNFNNQRYYSLNVWDAPEDEDYRPWTSVRDGLSIGMIDTTGTVRVPVGFAYEKRPQLVFYPTDKGELAAAKDPKTRKWGLINRKGEWKVQPFDVYEICWDSDTASFIDDIGKAVAL